MLRKCNRTIGSTDIVTVDFNPRLQWKKYWSSIGTLHIDLLNAPSLRDFTEGYVLVPWIEIHGYDLVRTYGSFASENMNK